MPLTLVLIRPAPPDARRKGPQAARNARGLGALPEQCDVLAVEPEGAARGTPLSRGHARGEVPYSLIHADNYGKQALARPAARFEGRERGRSTTTTAGP